MKTLLLIVMLFSVSEVEPAPITLTDEQQIQLAVLIQTLNDEVIKTHHRLQEALRERNEYYLKSKRQCI